MTEHITDRDLAAVAVGYEIAHREFCSLGIGSPLCSAHQPLSKEVLDHVPAQKARVMQALLDDEEFRAEERKQRLMSMVRNDLHETRWQRWWRILRRKSKPGIVRLGKSDIGPISLRLRQSDGTIRKIVPFEASLLAEEPDPSVGVHPVEKSDSYLPPGVWRG